MNQPEVQDTLQRVFREVFDEEDFEYSAALSRDTLNAWDSLGHVRLVAALEDAFDLSFTIEEIEGFTSAGVIAACVSARRGAAPRSPAH